MSDPWDPPPFVPPDPPHIPDTPPPADPGQQPFVDLSTLIPPDHPATDSPPAENDPYGGAPPAYDPYPHTDPSGLGDAYVAPEPPGFVDPSMLADPPGFADPYVAPDPPGYAEPYVPPEPPGFADAYVPPEPPGPGDLYVPPEPPGVGDGYLAPDPPRPDTGPETTPHSEPQATADGHASLIFGAGLSSDLFTQPLPDHGTFTPGSLPFAADGGEPAITQFMINHDGTTVVVSVDAEIRDGAVTVTIHTGIDQAATITLPAAAVNVVTIELKPSSDPSKIVDVTVNGPAGVPVDVHGTADVNLVSGVPFGPPSPEKPAATDPAAHPQHQHQEPASHQEAPRHESHENQSREGERHDHSSGDAHPQDRQQEPQHQDRPHDPAPAHPVDHEQRADQAAPDGQPGSRPAAPDSGRAAGDSHQPGPASPDDPVIPPVSRPSDPNMPGLDDLLRPDPPRTPFEDGIAAGHPFVHVVTPPHLDPHTITWLGRPADPHRTRFEVIDHPEMRVTGDDHPVEITVDPERMMPIRDPHTGELRGYRLRQGDTMYEFDRSGNLRDASGLEEPLATPAVDPIDAAMIIVDLGPILGKGISAGVEGLLAAAAKQAPKEMAQRGPSIARFGTEEVEELSKMWKERIANAPDAQARRRAEQALKALTDRRRIRDWDQSQREVAHFYEQIGGRYNTKPAKYVDAAGQKGKTIPDFYGPHVIGEVKNWEMVYVDEAGPLQRLAELREQIDARRNLPGAANIPGRTPQTVVLDLRGQVLSERDLQTIGHVVAEASDLPVENIQIIVWDK